jgi:hypothetical protein
MEHIEEGWNVVFVWVASRLTVFTEEGKVLGVRYYINSESTVDFKPLRAFAPVFKLNIRKHIAAVAASTITGRIII